MSLTASNTVITLTQPVLFPQGPQQIQGFATDDVMDIESAKIIESMMGVDGVLSFGFVWVERMMTIMLQADSLSNDFFDVINAQQEAAQDVYVLGGTIVQPAVGKKWILVNGGLDTYKPLAQAKKILQPRQYRIVWNRILPMPA